MFEIIARVQKNLKLFTQEHWKFIEGFLHIFLGTISWHRPLSLDVCYQFFQV
jgi:hypothetical protein